MSDFVNYTPGEYAKEHIRITPTTLADGRDFFYLDDDPEYVSGVKTRELKDPRQLPYRFSNQLNAAGEEVPYAAPEMRRDPLTGDWIPMATARMNRPITAGPGATAKGNPLAARKPGDPLPRMVLDGVLKTEFEGDLCRRCELWWHRLPEPA